MYTSLFTALVVCFAGFIVAAFAFLWDNLVENLGNVRERRTVIPGSPLENCETHVQNVAMNVKQFNPCARSTFWKIVCQLGAQNGAGPSPFCKHLLLDDTILDRFSGTPNIVHDQVR